jgi:hypothetical protein
MENQSLSIEPSGEASVVASIEVIEDEIATLSATIQAATYRLLCLVGELDRRSGWADPLDTNGFRSCAHWLSWRVGLNLGSARQYVRVARALPELTQISAAFGAGEVSYSKVRAITRIATPDNEELLLDLARAGTASHVEKLVREFRRANAAQENECAHEQQRSRRLVTWFDNDGMLVVRGRLTPEQGALLMKALDVSRDELNAPARGSAEPSGATDPAPQADGDQLRADALVRVAERALACDAAEASSADRFQVVVHVDAEVLVNPEADGRCELEDGPAMAPETVRRLACDATVCAIQHGPDGELTAGRKTRVVSTTLRRALKARDGTRCAFPGCGCRGRDAHHVQSWANGGPTVLGNILTVCRAHHTLVHEGGYRVEALPGGKFRFFRPDGREVLPAPPAPAVIGDPAEALAARWISPGVTLTPSTGRPTWDGEPVDYDWTLASLGTGAQ